MLYVVIGVVVGLIILGAVAGRGERKRAPAKLAEAKAAWAAKNRGQTFGALKEVLFDASGKYSADELKLSLEALELLDAVLAAASINPEPLTGEVKRSFSTGNAPNAKQMERVRKLVKRAAEKPDKLWSEVLGLDTPFFSADLEDAGPSSTGTMVASEVEITNQVGKALVFGGAAKALGIINTYLPTAHGLFRVTLLSQRGGCYSMEGRHDDAVGDYRECVKLEPDNVVHRTNLAEALLTQGQVAGAREQVAEATRQAKTKKQRESAEGMLRWFQ